MYDSDKGGPLTNEELWALIEQVADLEHEAKKGGPLYTSDGWKHSDDSRSIYRRMKEANK